MFGKLKEKLKNWFRKTEEKVEKTIEEEAKAEEKVEKIKEEIEEKSAAELKPKKAEYKEKPAEEKKSLFEKIKSKLRFKLTEDYFEEIFSELETVMLENNIALEVVEKIKKDLKAELVGLEIKKEEVEEKIKEALKISVESLFTESFNLIEKIKNKKEPYIILFFGINGSGKTTTLAKLVYLLQKNNISCILAASDTFRAASIEQLEKHAENLGVKVIKGKYGSDPASVAFDAIKHAKAKSIKAVLIDTAGRMYTKTDLMKEMEKISRISKPDLKIFVGESITGNDATQQAKTFNETIGIDAIILSKADVDEKGGTAISVSHVTGKPILYLGVGQEMEDLEKFDKEKLIKELGL